VHRSPDAAYWTDDTAIDDPEAPMSSVEANPERRWFRREDCRVDDLAALTAEVTDLADYPHAAAIEQNAVVYDGHRLRDLAGDPERRREVQGEIAHAFLHGPGVVAFTDAYADTAVVDRATESFFAMIADQHERGAVVGDHYAKPGANDRVWNSLEKLALGWPDVFVDYYANDVLALVCEAWLGPGYQFSSQINVVNPGGEAQQPHRDYHLGFMTTEQAARWPAHVHQLSPLLTLQGAVAHTDMPVESGPTMYLPHSQKYPAGYLAWALPEFKEHFRAHHAQLALRKGGAVFFNPALFHAAGTNRTADVKRMANLLQVSSSFGIAMETIDREAMSNALYPALQARQRAGVAETLLDRAVAASSYAYAFPTNLDRDPPVGGLAPEGQADFVRRALREDWDAERLRTTLADHAERRRSR
jgi:ectoine hydroxylase-related dioxygenase (phytanoyl-CoA dioxygenase family)